LSTTAAMPGIGKSSLLLVEAIAMATGRDLLGVPVPKRLPVWYWNDEEEEAEIWRRMAAICLYYRIDPVELELERYLDVKAAIEAEIALASMIRLSPTVNTQVVQELQNEIADKDFDVFIIDPFTSAHRASRASPCRIITDPVAVP
jgi:RecA-family ATPase